LSHISNRNPLTAHLALSSQLARLAKNEPKLLEHFHLKALGTVPVSPPLFHMLQNVSSSLHRVLEAAAMHVKIPVNTGAICAQLPPTWAA
jgi:hypothetical protein